jgi:predicted ATPase/DNA-binding CsgD family transcriptional regulator
VLPLILETVLINQTRSSYLHNLPSPLSSFIGRNRDLAEIQRLLSKQRLVTLTGPGGSGKTRLALHAAWEAGPAYAGGIWLAELASLADPALLPQTLASVLNVREEAGRPWIQSIIDHLQKRQVLLLLDNCEHLVEACAQLCTGLLSACPDIRILTTSREILRVPGEAVWQVPPLSLPELQPWRSPNTEREAFSAYEQSEAVQLFAARAAASSSFTLTSQNVAWVADICRRLDGLPLAIELAAARTRAFSVREIAERLDDRFRLLSGGPRTVAPRHQTLEATLDWSYDLLPASEQQVLRRLTVFAGGWTLEAAEAVCAGVVAPADVLPTLANLVDKSLVVVEPSAQETRYRYLETIRTYAQLKVEQANEVDQSRDQHLYFFVDWAEAGAVQLAGSEQPLWITRFATEHDNIRAAFEWSMIGKTRAEKGLRLAAACGHFWRLRSLFSEGRSRLARALAQPGAQAPTLARARAVLWAANLAYLQSDFAATRALAEEGLAISRGLGPEGRASTAKALDLLGELCTEIGDYEAMPAYFEESLAIFRELDDKPGIADLLMQFGWAAMRAGDYPQAAPLLAECLQLFRELGASVHLAIALGGSGELAIRQGAYDQAIELLEESLALRRELGDLWGIAGALGSLGWVALLQRDFSRMNEMLAESLSIRLEIGERGGLAWCLEKLAEAVVLQAQALPVQRRRPEFLRATRILGAAQTLRQSVNAVIDPADQPAYENLRTALQAALGSELFSETWAAGASLPVQAAVDQALSPPLILSEADALSSNQAAKARFGGLSRREREVVAWVAQGKTNREIAELMVVGGRTIETYITRILNKLGLNSRVQIATWALSVGLPKPNEETEEIDS